LLSEVVVDEGHWRGGGLPARTHLPFHGHPDPHERQRQPPAAREVAIRQKWSLQINTIPSSTIFVSNTALDRTFREGIAITAEFIDLQRLPGTVIIIRRSTNGRG
jgi:hypothetical protein